MIEATVSKGANRRILASMASILLWRIFAEMFSSFLLSGEIKGVSAWIKLRSVSRGTVEGDDA